MRVREYSCDASFSNPHNSHRSHDSQSPRKAFRWLFCPVDLSVGTSPWEKAFRGAYGFRTGVSQAGMPALPDYAAAAAASENRLRISMNSGSFLTKASTSIGSKWLPDSLMMMARATSCAIACL